MVHSDRGSVMDLSLYVTIGFSRIHVFSPSCVSCEGYQSPIVLLRPRLPSNSLWSVLMPEYDPSRTMCVLIEPRS